MRRPWAIASVAAVLAAGGALAAVLAAGPAATTGRPPPAGEPGPAAATSGREPAAATAASQAIAASRAAAPAPGTSGDGYARNVTAGAACSPAGAVGFSAQATLLRCATDTADPQLRWRRP